MYRFNKINTCFYHANGTKQKQGKARIVQEEKTLHFFYYGEWLVYDSKEFLVKKQIYENGIKFSEIDFKNKNNKNINDSLVIVLKKLNQEIYLYQDSVNLSEKKYGKNSKPYQRAVSLNALHTSKLLTELNDIIAKFGYPGKTLAGSDFTIAFSIISSANLSYKEKYFDLITNAANTGELDWTDVAFFVDKVKVAKKEKQIYGTQHQLNTDETDFLYYPIENIEQLNDRRKKLGLMK
jgi:hypothetical protein